MSELAEVASKYASMLRRLRPPRVIGRPRHALHEAIYLSTFPGNNKADARTSELLSQQLDPIPANGAAIAERLFRARAIKDLSVVRRVIEAQQPSGSFLRFAPDDSAEVFWYSELVILHAVATTVIREDLNDLRDAVLRSTNFCMREIQPDHATTRPWAIHAFVLNPDSRPMADWMIHAFEHQAVDSVDDLSLMLLDDCIYCLKRLAGETHGNQ